MLINTKIWVTDSVPASGSLTQSLLLDAAISCFWILKLQVTPSASGGDSKYQIFYDNTFTGALGLEERLNSLSPLYDPVRLDASGNMTQEGISAIGLYEDEDETGKLHVKIFNQASVARTYEVKIWYLTPTDPGHIHDDRYYTETEIATILGDYYTAAEVDTLLGDYYTQAEIDTLVDNYVEEDLFNANSILVADEDDTPLALNVPFSRILGRGATGDIAALTAAEVRTLLSLVPGTDFVARSGGYFTDAVGIESTAPIFNFYENDETDHWWRIVADAGSLRFDYDTDQDGYFSPSTRALKLLAAGTVALMYGVAINEFSSDGTMAGNSDSACPTEKAVVTYAMPFTGGVFTGLTEVIDTFRVGSDGAMRADTEEAHLVFYSNDPSAEAAKEAAAIRMICGAQDWGSSATYHSAHLGFETINAGTLAERMRLRSDGGLTIDGTTDTEQLIVQAHSTQNDDIVQVQDSEGANLVEVDGAGRISQIYTAYQTEGIIARYSRTATPSQRFHEIRGRHDSVASGNYLSFYIHDGVTTTSLANVLTIRGDGSVGVLDPSPSYAFEVNGTCNVVDEFTAGTKTFRIDHPLDPENKLLYHAALEGPRVDLIYRGTAQLVNGKATVNLDTDATVHPMVPGTFEALTQNAQIMALQPVDSLSRVQCTGIIGNQFEIESEDPNSSDYVNWIVMAERADPFIKSIDTTDADGRLIPEHSKEEPDMNRLEPEEREIKDDSEERIEDEPVQMKGKGYYIHNEAYGVELPTKKVKYVKPQEPEDLEPEPEETEKSLLTE